MDEEFGDVDFTRVLLERTNDESADADSEDRDRVFELSAPGTFENRTYKLSQEQDLSILATRTLSGGENVDSAKRPLESESYDASLKNSK